MVACAVLAAAGAAAASVTAAEPQTLWKTYPLGKRALKSERESSAASRRVPPSEPPASRTQTGGSPALTLGLAALSIAFLGLAVLTVRAAPGRRREFRPAGAARALGAAPRATAARLAALRSAAQQRAHELGGASWAGVRWFAGVGTSAHRRAHASWSAQRTRREAASARRATRRAADEEGRARRRAVDEARRAGGCAVDEERPAKLEQERRAKPLESGHASYAKRFAWWPSTSVLGLEDSEARRRSPRGTADDAKHGPPKGLAKGHDQPGPAVDADGGSRRERLVAAGVGRARLDPAPAVQPATRARGRSVAGRSIGKSLAAAGGSQLALIVSGVLVARSLGPEDRGYLALLVMVAGIFSLIGTIGLPSAVTYFIARDRSQARDIATSFIGPAILLMGATLILQIGVLTALVAHDPERVKVAALISLLLVPGFPAFAFGTAILQGQQRFTAFNILRTLPTVAYVAGVAVVFLLGRADLVFLMAMWAGANFVGGFLALGVATRGLPTAPADNPPPSRSQVTRFGLKSLFGSLSPVDSFRLDQAVVGLFLNPVALGLYVVAQAVTNLPRVIAASIGMVAYPQVASQSNSAAARRTMWKYFAFGVALSALVVGALEVVTGDLITFFFGSQFGDATPIARMLLLATFFMTARRVLTDGMNGMGHPALGTLAEVASWLLLLPTIAVLLPRLGVNGVALALAISWGASLLLLLGLVGMTLTRRRWLPGIRGDLTGRFGTRLSLVPAHRFAALMGAVAAAIAVGIAAARFPARPAAVVVLALCVALLFAFGRTALRRRSHSRFASAKARQSRTHVYEVTAQRPDAEFRAARNVYYLGLVFLGLLTIRAGGQVTFSDLLFLFSFVLASAELVILRRQVPIRLPVLLLLGMALFSLGAVLSTFESYEPVKSLAIVVRFIVLTVFWFWLGTIVLHRREHVTKALTLWVASAAICGAGGIAQVVVGDVIPGASSQWGRATGFTTNGNDLGGLTSIAFVPALMLAARPTLATSQRVLSYVLLLLVGAGLVLSGSVGALLAGVIATVVWVAFQKCSVHSLFVFAAIGLCMVAVVTVQAMRGAPTPLDRLNTVKTSGTAGRGAGSLDSRVATYRVAMKAIKEHPFIGVGLDLVSVTKPSGVVSYEHDVHNLVIGVWYKTGLIGLAGMLILVSAVLRTGWIALLQQVSGADRRIGIALICSICAFIVFAMSEPVLFSRFGWVPAALVVALRAVQQRGVRVSRVGAYDGDLGMADDGQSPALAPVRP